MLHILRSDLSEIMHRLSVLQAYRGLICRLTRANVCSMSPSSSFATSSDSSQGVPVGGVPEDSWKSTIRAYKHQKWGLGKSAVMGMKGGRRGLAILHCPV